MAMNNILLNAKNAKLLSRDLYSPSGTFPYKGKKTEKGV